MEAKEWHERNDKNEEKKEQKEGIRRRQIGGG